jgi:hypothetical protein
MRERDCLEAECRVLAILELKILETLDQTAASSFIKFLRSIGRPN